MIRFTWLIAAIALLPCTIQAQQKLTMADAVNKGRSALAPATLSQLQWIPGVDTFAYAAQNKAVRVAARTLQADTLDLLPLINAQLAQAGRAAVDRLVVRWASPGEARIQTPGESWAYDLNEQRIRLLNSWPKDAQHLDLHPGSQNAAYTRDGGLYLSVGMSELQIAQSERPGIVYGESVHRNEFGIEKGTFWSPSGRSIAFYRMDESMATTYPIYELDSMPAAVRLIRYPFAGAKSHHVTVGVYHLDSSKTVWLDTGLPAEQYLTNIAWTPDESGVLVAVVNRDQNHMQLRLYDARSGALLRILFDEKSETWTEPEKPAVFVPGRNTYFVWESERDGVNRLYLYDLEGRMLRQVSRGEGPVTQFYGFSADGQYCFYQEADASGMNRHLVRAPLYNRSLPTPLTREEGVHQGLMSHSGDWMLDLYSEPGTPRMIWLTPTSDPEARQTIFGAKNPLADYKIGLTRMLTIPSPGGFTLNGRMILPPDFDARKRYPAIVYVYNGPHVQLVNNSWLGGAEVWMHYMAQEGYVIFTLDGRGSANRGHAFESAIYRRLGDAEIEDQLTGVAYLRAQPFIDPERLGVYGWSYGGFMATSLMTRPEAKGAFKCGVAGGPVIDWSMYEIMYTERYMDTPQQNPDGYRKSNLLNYVDNLEGRLLMIHGGADDVVLWQHSLLYVRECIRKGKQIDYFVYPHHLHNVSVPERVHLFEKIERFFKENL